MDYKCILCRNYVTSNAYCATCTNYSNLDPVLSEGTFSEQLDKTVGTKDDSGKTDWTLMPWKELEEVTEVLQFGASKYSRDNWKLVEADRYRQAALRHLISYISGEKTDPESGKSHLAHLVCNALFLIWKENEAVSRNN